MQIHHAIEYNMFEDLAEKAKYYGEVLILGPAMLSAIVMMLPVFITIRCAESVARRLRLW